MNNTNRVVRVAFAVAVLIMGVAGGYWYGNREGYSAGYKKAEADVALLQEEATKKATEEAVKAANPFQTSNPLEGVEANPFEKAKQILNPFQ